MKRTVLSLVFLAASGLALCSQTASVHAAGSTITLPTMYHTDEEQGAMFVGAKDHYDIGDKLVFSAPLYTTKDLDTKGAKPVATFYGEATVLKGGVLSDLLTMLHFDFVFPNGDHITGQGLVNWKPGTQSAAITGGTGTYEGARGTVHHGHGVDDLVVILK